MLRFYSLLLWSCLPILAFATKRDSLVHLIEQSVSDTQKVLLYNELAFLQIDTSFKHANENIQFAETLSRDIGYEYGLAVSLYNKSRNYGYNNEFEKAKTFILESVAIFDKSEEHQKSIDCYILLGWLSDKIAEYYQALENFQIASDLALKHGLDSNLGAIYINIGRIHNLLGDFPTAITYYSKAGKSYTKRNDQLGLAYYHTNIGYVYYQQKKFDKCQFHYDKALEITADKEILRLESNVLQNKMLAYIENKQFDEAEKLSARVYELDSSIKDEIGLAYLSLSIAKIAIGRTEKVSNMSDLINAYEVGRKTKDVELQRESARLLSEIYQANGDYKQAIIQEKLSNTLKDSISSNEVKFKISKLEYQKEIEIQKKDLLLKENELKRSLDRQSEIKRSLILPLILLSIFSLFQYRQYKSTNKTKNELEKKNQALRKTETELEQKNRDLQKYIEHNIELEQFAHIASHDIKSPLRTIASFTGLLKNKFYPEASESQKEHFNFLERGVKRLENLVDDLLQFSVINSQELNLEQSTPKAIFSEVVENLEYDIQERQAEILMDGCETPFNVDKTKIKQVIQNLISNSLKFKSSERPLKIEFSCKCNADVIFVSVSDNGIGIPAKFHNSVFNKFTQLNSKDQYEGTGLGLSICKKYIEKHQGEIWVSNNGPHGVTVSFTIPNNLDLSEA